MASPQPFPFNINIGPFMRSLMILLLSDFYTTSFLCNAVIKTPLINEAIYSSWVNYCSRIDVLWKYKKRLLVSLRISVIIGRLLTTNECLNFTPGWPHLTTSSLSFKSPSSKKWPYRRMNLNIVDVILKFLLL